MASAVPLSTHATLPRLFDSAEQKSGEKLQMSISPLLFKVPLTALPAAPSYFLYERVTLVLWC